MVNVIDIMRSYPDPSGNVPSDDDVSLARSMKSLLQKDLSESDLAQAVRLFNDNVSSAEMLNAWWLLGSGVRAAWKNLLEYETWLQTVRHVD